MRKSIGVAVNDKIKFTTYKQCVPLLKKTNLITTQEPHESDGINPEECY